MTQSTPSPSSLPYSETDLKELIFFLRSTQQHVRSMASQVILDLSGGNFMDVLLTLSSNYQGALLRLLLESLKDLVLDSSSIIAANAVHALVNFTIHGQVHSYFEDNDFIRVVLHFILSPTSHLADSACKLLSNLTHHIPIAQLLLDLPRVTSLQASPSSQSLYSLHQFKKVQECTSALHQLVEVFCSVLVNTETERGYNPAAAYHDLASVLANVSRLKPSPYFFFHLSKVTTNDPTCLPSSAPLLHLLPFLSHPHRTRRLGLVHVFKNLAFHQTCLGLLLSTVVDPVLHRLTPPSFWDTDDENVLDHPVYALEPNMEPHLDVQVGLLELVLVCTATRFGRTWLRQRGCYEVVRAFHLQCTDMGAVRVVEMIVDHLMREEASLEDEDGNERKTEI